MCDCCYVVSGQAWGRIVNFNQDSGKEKAHKHKRIFPVIARVAGGSPDRVARGLPTGGQGSKVYVLCAEPKEHKLFRPGTRPGGPVTGVTEKLFMCQMFMCLFRPLRTLSFNDGDAHQWPCTT